MQTLQFTRALAMAARACPCSRAVTSQVFRSPVLGLNVVRTSKAQSRTLTSFKAHQLDEAITLEPAGQEGVWKGRTHQDYVDIVGPFGGIIAAQGLQAVLKHPRRQGDPVTMTLNYLAPMSEGDFQITTSLKQHNRNTQHWSLDIVQGKQVVAQAMLMLGSRKETFAHVDVSMPEAPAPDALQPFKPNGLKWTQSYEFRFATGELVTATNNKPTQQSEIPQGGSRSLVWLKENPPRPLDFPGLAALCDTFFPRVFQLRRATCPAGTDSITINFHVCEEELNGLGGDFLLGEAQANVLRRGYQDQHASLWSRDGRLLATTSQMLHYKC